jgi:hypothetical protein
MSKRFQTFQGWKRAVRERCANVTFEGDKDICQAWGDGKYAGEWDGETGEVFTTNSPAGTNKEK